MYKNVNQTAYLCQPKQAQVTDSSTVIVEGLSLLTDGSKRIRTHLSAAFPAEEPRGSAWCCAPQPGREGIQSQYGTVERRGLQRFLISCTGVYLSTGDSRYHRLVTKKESKSPLYLHGGRQQDGSVHSTRHP
jgi:hypothetical protein